MIQSVLPELIILAILIPTMIVFHFWAKRHNWASQKHLALADISLLYYVTTRDALTAIRIFRCIAPRGKIARQFGRPLRVANYVVDNDAYKIVSQFLTPEPTP